MGIPKEVVEKAFSIFQDDDDLGQGYRLLKIEYAPGFIAESFSGEFIYKVTIAAPSGVAIEVYSSEQ